MGLVGSLVIARWSYGLLRDTSRVLLDTILSIVAHAPREPEHYKRLVAGQRDLVHVTVEVHRCPDGATVAA